MTKLPLFITFGILAASINAQVSTSGQDVTLENTNSDGTLYLKAGNVPGFPPSYGANIQLNGSADGKGSLLVRSGFENLGNGNAGDMHIQSHNNINFKVLNTVNSEGSFIFEGSNVGIGTTTPKGKLNVNGETYIDGWLRVTGKRGLLFQDYGGGFRMADNTWIRTYGGKSFYHDSGTMRTDGVFQVGSGGNRLLVKADGNVGIGTTNPNTQLHVKTSDHDVMTLESTGADVGLTFKNSVSPNGANIRYDSGTNGIEFRANGIGSSDTKMFISDSGNVGIGTTSPQERLHVKSGTASIEGNIGIPTDSYWKPGNHNLELQNGDAGEVVLSFHRGGHTNAAIVHTTSGGLRFSGNGSPSSKHMYVNSDGKVGIGTSDTKGFELGVLGKIAATEVKVAEHNNWPDFVFENDYKLPTLKDVENHISEKGHLENVPSAREVEKDGFFLGQMDAKLLQKIEELTLYTIQQQKEIESLKKENTDNKVVMEQLSELLTRVKALEEHRK